MENHNILIIIFLLFVPVELYIARSYTKLIRKWKSIEPQTFKEQGHPNESYYHSLSSIRIMLGFLLNNDYSRKLESIELKREFKRLNFTAWLSLIIFILLTIYIINF